MRTSRERNLATVLEAAQEGMMRGIRFLPVHVCHSDAARFVIEEEGLRPPPLITVPSLAILRLPALLRRGGNACSPRFTTFGRGRS